MSCKKCSEIETPKFTGLTDSNGNELFDGDYLDKARFTKGGCSEIINSCRVLYYAKKAAFVVVGIDDLDNVNTDYLHTVIGHTAVKTANPNPVIKELLDHYGTESWAEKYNEYYEAQADLEDAAE